MQRKFPSGSLIQMKQFQKLVRASFLFKEYPDLAGSFGCVLECVHHLFVHPDFRGGLAFGDALCGFFHEQDPNGREADLEVFGEARFGDIHQVHEQFVIGGCIVLAVYLGVAGQAAAALEAQVELRKCLFVLGSDLRALGPRADDGHIAFQDVEELRQLVHAAGADEAADFRDPRIRFSG